MSRTTKIILGVGALIAIVVIGLGALGVWWFFRDDAPAKVSLSSAVESVGGAPGTASTSGTAAANVSGTWTIDSKIGTFDFNTATGTFAGFRVKENLAGIGSTEAVGRTAAVTGTMTISGDSVIAASFTIDLTTITTNDRRRDDKVQSAVETRTFPQATFALTDPIPLGAGAASGGPINVDAIGDFTLHGVTVHATIPLQAQRVGDTIVVVGSYGITFSDHGVQVPTSPIVLSVTSSGTLEFQLLFVRS
jgi:polyisoprenoid-binding protein YceI